MEELSTRDEIWLRERVKLLREVHFADVASGYPIITRFGLRAKNRFGSIEAKKGQSIITMNRLFSHPQVPEYVVDATIAHELAHYAHGYGSGLPKLHDNPHRGGVVDKELDKRGLGELRQKAESWRETHWHTFYQTQCGDIVSRKSQISDLSEDRWRTFIERPGNRNEAELNKRLQFLMQHMNLSFTEGKSISVEWLHASSRQTGLSYWFYKEAAIRINGLLADRRIPDYVLDFEIIYWLVRLVVGSNWKKVEAKIVHHGLKEVLEQGLHWRQRYWKSFRSRHHPL